jgi:hypothetical protein
MRPAIVSHRRRRGQALVESALVVLAFFTIVIGILDCGQVLFIHNALVDRVRTTLRWAAVNPYNETQIRNMVRYYTESPSEGAEPYLGMTEAQVQVTRLDAGLSTERIRIAIVGYPYHFFTPLIAKTFTNNLAVVETLPSEYRP